MSKKPVANEEQSKAIEAPINNTIVSAGAGSGKTFVLKNRVQRTLLNGIKDGIKVDQLIILTFTNAAANEMKDRIRKVIRETPDLADQIDLVESAYITTFDSFAQSLVKKYSYLLNIDKNFTIVDTNIVKTELSNIVEEILNEYYKNPTEEFDNFINDFCYKDDSELINKILNIYNALTNIKNRDNYLNTYIDEFYKDEKINKFIDEYHDLISEKTSDLIPLYNTFIDHVIETNALDFWCDRKERLINAVYPEEIVEIISETKPRDSAKNPIYDDKDKAEAIKDIIKDIEKDIINLSSYTDEELRNQFLYTKNNVNILINILKELDKRILEFKNEKNAYEFQDIAFKAIELVRDHEDVRNEIKNKTLEIMIDEYQDTNDIQEEFISYIANKNVYMVGDIKQSIYRFRNANPYIFKDKYDRYSKGEDGTKIDMTKNFRSRTEVIDNINDIFSSIMFDDIGGANYKNGHQMEAKFDGYDKKIDSYDYKMQILNYTNTDNKYNKEEIEAFAIAQDIKNKMSSNMFTIDGDGNQNKLDYKDFCILVDKSKNFDLLKKVLEYHNIPSVIEKDISIKEDDEVYILNNLITLLIQIKKEEFNPPFNHAYMSIARSYIFKMTDEEIYEAIVNKTFKETDLYKKLYELSKSIDGLSNKEILIKLINEFDMFKKIITVGDIHNRSTKLEYFINNADDLNKFGYDIYKLNEYFDKILKSDDPLRMEVKSISKNAVRIMTIHKSKGLEFPFVYLPYLYSEFKGRKKPKYPLNEQYGIITPYKEDNLLNNTFMNNIYEYNDLKENVSEKIRLFYVATTRAREQLIIINSWNEKKEPNNNIISLDLIKCKTFKDILTLLKNRLLPYTKELDLKVLNISNAYNLYSNTNYDALIKESDVVIKTNELNIENKIVDNKHFSKQLKKIIDEDLKETLDYGTYIHYCFEVYDFNHDNLDKLNMDEEYKTYIRNFLKHDEVKNISNAKVYKEHEIKYKKDNNIMHGFIDLLVEYDDHFDIIDYKTDNVDSEDYINQLNGYKDYIENKYKKETNIYLYSVKQDLFKKL